MRGVQGDLIPPLTTQPSQQQSGNSISLKIAQDYADPVFQLAQSGTAAPPPPPAIFPISNMNNTTLTDEQINRQYEDLTAIACLLCKRKFPSVENLKRHQELSDLHKVCTFSIVGFYVLLIANILKFLYPRLSDKFGHGKAENGVFSNLKFRIK